jgi:hypothetical protein
MAIAGCTDYVKKADYDSTISELRGTDQNLQSQIDGLSAKYDTLAREVAGRVRIDSGAHFATGDATLMDQDKPFPRRLREDRRCASRRRRDRRRLRRSARRDRLQPRTRHAPRECGSRNSWPATA